MRSKLWIPTVQGMPLWVAFWPRFSSTVRTKSRQRFVPVITPPNILSKSRVRNCRLPVLTNFNARKYKVPCMRIKNEKLFSVKMNLFYTMGTNEFLFTYIFHSCRTYRHRTFSFLSSTQGNPCDLTIVFTTQIPSTTWAFSVYRIPCFHPWTSYLSCRPSSYWLFLSWVPWESSFPFQSSYPSSFLSSY